MKRVLRILALALMEALMVALMGGCGAEVAANPDVTLFAVNVGKGDALILRVGNWTGLIDAGKPRAMGRVRSALEKMGVERLDGVFLTHTDNDHAGGLEWLSGSDIAVDAWYAPAMYTGVKEKKHPARQAAEARGQEVQWLRRGDAVEIGDGAALRVLAPASLYDDKDDNNSLVMLLESDQGRMLLTGDMELPEEEELLSFGDDLSCDLLKVPNHGDDDTTSEEFARAAGAGIALVSTDSQEKPGTPDPGVVARLMAAGSRVVVTEATGLGLRVDLRAGEATVSETEFPTPLISGLRIAAVDADDDRITLRNDGAEAVDLGGFYLHSERGNELYAFPAGTTLAPGGALTVGATDTDGDFDLLWDDKKVVHPKKNDVITLYDPCGRPLDSGDNGLKQE